jgi:CheY-like chemotaxis protein
VGTDKTKRRRCILVVEDEMLLAFDIADMLADAGYDTRVAGSVGKALTMLEETAIDAALLDVNLGTEKVYPVADALAAGGVPFVFVTAYSPSAIEKRYDGTPVFTKPLGEASITDIMATLFRGA